MIEIFLGHGLNTDAQDYNWFAPIGFVIMYSLNCISHFSSMVVMLEYSLVIFPGDGEDSLSDY